MKRERIDKIICELGFSDSLKNAQALIMSGKVLVNERRVEKPSELFSSKATIRIKGEEKKHKYVGRGGLKLAKALEEFHIQPNEYVCLDVGASTGGFSDCLLLNGAKKIIAVDVGTNQIDWKLRNNEKIEVRENTNARYLKPQDFPEKFDLIVMDVSFISVTKIFPVLLPLLRDDGKIITLVKPQFEVEKGEVGEGGIVREAAMHEKVLSRIKHASERIGLNILGLTESPILGAEGNKEFLILYEKRKEN